MAFPFFIFPHCCNVYTGIKDYWRDPQRGNKEEGERREKGNKPNKELAQRGEE